MLFIIKWTLTQANSHLFTSFTSFLNLRNIVHMTTMEVTDTEYTPHKRNKLK